MSQTTKKTLKPVCLAIVRLRPNESRALASVESHLFPTWWAKPHKLHVYSVFGKDTNKTVQSVHSVHWLLATSDYLQFHEFGDPFCLPERLQSPCSLAEWSCGGNDTEALTAAVRNPRESNPRGSKSSRIQLQGRRLWQEDAFPPKK